MELHERIFELALKRSFFFPSNEPYSGMAGFYDYGPVGVLLKHKIEELWRKQFIKSNGYHEVETSIVTPEPVLEASGHVSSFADPIVECAQCKTSIRADTFIEEKHYSKHGERWDGKLESLDNVISEKALKCPRCNGDFGKCFMFNLMFRTGIGGNRLPAYTRPETAQGIFTAFPRLFKNHGTALPLAIGQIGKSFRNEISPRKGLVRMREFTQMELEYFFDPEQNKYDGFCSIAEEKMTMAIEDKKIQMTAKELVEKGVASNEIMAYFLVLEWEFYKQVGIKEEDMWFRVLGKNEIPHYSKGNIDMEVKTSFGNIETIGNAYRTDFDLSQHAAKSGKDFGAFVDGRKITPHVFEVSMGVDRLVFCILEQCFRDKTETSKQNPKLESEASKSETGNAKLETDPAKSETENRKLETGKDWEWFDFPPAIAPYHVAVYPLMKKDGMAEKAEEIVAMLRSKGFDVLYRRSGSIGRRYASGDEVGIPYAITIDYDTLQDGTVTLRYRNDGQQERIKINDCETKLNENILNGKVSL
ncbi:glycine--tRNA ligase [Candidatus Micrarchaeota archaeon]|nr:glycine--tRNA ligase [Candidatus Micrarchaeota archaeon]MBU1165351.1 glycine--tRNA ligase [Candidatus Micrarchaeota archaeon]MBU1886707.1 glycine--tRNA ligase [Candidatus Micrarchaeota archaeon]